MYQWSSRYHKFSISPILAFSGKLSMMGSKVHVGVLVEYSPITLVDDLCTLCRIYAFKWTIQYTYIMDIIIRNFNFNWINQIQSAS